MKLVSCISCLPTVSNRFRLWTLNAQVALMETGEIDAAPIELKNLPRMLDGGFQTADNGLAGLASVVFSGNLWETNHVVSNEPLDTAAVYMRDLPWIGDPSPDNKGDKNKNISDLEEARLVRNALARAIDRDLINTALLNGLGFPNYLCLLYTSPSPRD